MAFNANAVVLRQPYTPETHEAKLIEDKVLRVASRVLGTFGMKIHSTVNRSEYDKFTQSKPVNRYVRVEKKTPEKQDKEEDKYKMVKVGEGRYRSEVFASVKYALVSISVMKEFTIVWFSFHPKLDKMITHFGDFTFNLAQNLSVGNQVESMVMYATSTTRQGDIFSLYVSGRERNSLSGKGALTEVRDMYAVDINTVMDNIDQNLAIYYAPIDFAEVKKDIAEQKSRYESLKNQAGKLAIENKEDGSDMNVQFQKENDELMAELQVRYGLVEKAMKSDPIGNVIFFKLDEADKVKEDRNDERHFGRPVK